jgi:hypothetical protein
VSDTPAPWRALFDALEGGRACLASLCQVSESTVYRWSRGSSPGFATISYVNTLCDSHGVARVFPITERKASSA